MTVGELVERLTYWDQEFQLKVIPGEGELDFGELDIIAIKSVPYPGNDFVCFLVAGEERK